MGFYKETNDLIFFRNSYEIAKFLTANGLLPRLLLLTKEKGSNSIMVGADYITNVMLVRFMPQHQQKC